MKQCCETSFKNGKTSKLESWVQSWRPRAIAFCDVSILRLPRKSDASSPVMQNHLSKPEDLTFQIATHLRKSTPGLLTSLMNMSLVLHLPGNMHLCKSSSHDLLTFDQVQTPLRLPRETASERWKAVRDCQFLTLWLRNVLCSTTACFFSTSELPKVLRGSGVLNILTSKCASRHATTCNFDFSRHLARWLRTQRFSEPTFRPSGATNHLKKRINYNFPTFSRTCIFFPLSLSLLWSSLFFSSFRWLFPSWLFPPLLFHLSILSEVWLLNFLRIVTSQKVLLMIGMI